MAETFRFEYVKCGKANCRSCPHGPYWYAYWREGKRVRKRYVGKNREGRRGEWQDPDPVRAAAATGDDRDAIFKVGTASGVLAKRILGLPSIAPYEECYEAYKRKIKEHHPDRGGDEKEAKYVTAAWTWLKTVTFASR